MSTTPLLSRSASGFHLGDPVVLPKENANWAASSMSTSPSASISPGGRTLTRAPDRVLSPWLTVFSLGTARTVEFGTHLPQDDCQLYWNVLVSSTVRLVTV